MYINDTMYVYIQWLFPTKSEETINQQSWNQLKEYYSYIVQCIALSQMLVWLPHDAVEWNIFSRFKRCSNPVIKCNFFYWVCCWIVYCRLWRFTEVGRKENIKIINRTIYV